MLFAEKNVSQNISDNLSDKIIHIETLGCRLNQIESEGAASVFSDSGFTVKMTGITAREKENENVIIAILNTCTVTAKAEQKARRLIRLLLKKYFNALIIVTGCYAQVNRKEISAIDSRVLVLPGLIKSRLVNVPAMIKSVFAESNKSPSEISEKIKAVLKNSILKNEKEKTSENPFLLSTDTFLHHSRASLKIQDGCNNRCSYCEICIARGSSVSLEAEEVLKRVESLKEAGNKEIVLTTVNIAQYRSEYNGRVIDITGLLELLLKKTNGVSFRFSSLYPQIIDEKFALLLKDARVRPHFHLSVQSGSDEILKKMNRPYGSEAVEKATRILRMTRPDCFLACDIIAGFPGETDEDFEKTLDLVKNSGFTYVHAFPFSPRPDTKAYTMKPKVPEAVTQKRVQKLLDYSVKAKTDYINSVCGTIREAIVETSHSKNVLKEYEGKKIVYAVTDNFLHCIVDCGENEIPESSSVIKIKIVKPLSDMIEKNDEMEALAQLWI